MKHGNKQPITESINRKHGYDSGIASLFLMFKLQKCGKLGPQAVKGQPQSKSPYVKSQLSDKIPLIPPIMTRTICIGKSLRYSLGMISDWPDSLILTIIPSFYVQHESFYPVLV